MTQKRCPQCYRELPSEAFLGGKRDPSKPTLNCTECLTRYSKGNYTMTKSWRPTTASDEPLRVRFTRESKNTKLGLIPVSTSSPSTCPTSCAWYGAGCYAEFGHMGGRWKRTAVQGLKWEDFCAEVAALPEGQLWRHNEAGDLPGRGSSVDHSKLKELVDANFGRRGFTYTHKWSPDTHGIISRANQQGFTINVSCDSFEEIDRIRVELAGARLPLVAVVPSDHPQLSETPGGAKLVVCPNETTGITCAECELCANPNRKSVVAFRAHGQSAVRVSLASVQRRLPMLGNAYEPPKSPTTRGDLSK